MESHEADNISKGLQREILLIKKGLKEWEYNFTEKYNRKPTMQDIEARPKVLKVYKDYHNKKKLLKLPPKDKPKPTSPHRHVAYIRSPNFDRVRPVEGIPMTSSKRRPSTAFDSQYSQPERTNSSSQPTPDTPTTMSAATEDAFWFPSTQPTDTKRRKKKNVALEQKLIGHLMWKPRDTLSAALKAERDSQQAPEKDAHEETSGSQLKASMPTAPPRYASSLEIGGLSIANHQDNHLRHYHPSLFQSAQSLGLTKDGNDDDDDDDLFMPGMFSSVDARTTLMTPMLEKDPDRYCRVVSAMKQGTLGVPRPDDEDVDMDDDLQQFITENTAMDYQPEVEDKNTPTWKKKPIQKRQTRLYKLKFVDTSPSRS
ncbi:hypothetical protein DM01DRAFT_1383576 [Hesseltinella vesiculosa]|uniref:DNA replication regulator SLD2 n=1 Tax=Hesseltinella vesiculosa TaxID=101127 RepID=A0A1X2GH06_9FUNG|nr:hypothetical protein DM01DRAFT_1383576 [Hesseltinella vesiculosa]